MVTTLRPGRISPPRQVPAQIKRPEYVGKRYPKTGEPDVKDAETIAAMRVAGRLAAQALAEVGRFIDWRSYRLGRLQSEMRTEYKRSAYEK